jgi:hypothetical protein
MRLLSHFFKIFYLFIFLFYGFFPLQCIAKELNFINLSKEERRDIEATIIENVKLVNKSLPIMVDDETRLDSALAVGMQMHFKYTMVNTELDNIDVNIFRNTITSNLIKGQKSDKNALFMLRTGVIYYFNYFDKNGLLITQIRIDGAMCGIR